MSLSKDGRLLATGSGDTTARVTDITTGRIIREIYHNDIVLAVSLSGDGELLATGSRDKSARITDITTGDIIGTV